MANQGYATTGRRPRSSAVARINAQSPYLPAQYQQNWQKQYQQSIYDQANNQLGLERELGERGLGIQESGLEIQAELLDLERAKMEQAYYDMEERRRLQEEQIKFATEQAKTQEEQAKKARLLGIGQMGVQAYLGNEKKNAMGGAVNPMLDSARGMGDFSRNSAMNDIEAGRTMAGENLWGNGLPEGQEGMAYGATSNRGGEITNMQSQYPPATAASSDWSLGTFSDPNNAWNSAKANYMPILGGGLAGGTLGASLGQSYIPWGGKNERGMWGGLLGGGLSSYYMSGGDPWSTVLGGLLGGGLSFSGLGDLF